MAGGDDRGVASFDIAPLVEYSDRQLTLIGVLGDRSGDFNFAAMFQGALAIRQQSANPINIVLAAHGIRELMEKLPESYDVPKRGPGLTDQVRTLHAGWKTMREKSKCKHEAGWAGTVDRPLKGILDKLSAFFDRFAEDFPNRRDRVGTFFVKADPRGAPLPESIRIMRIGRWMMLWNYFTEMAHHRADAEQFDARLEEFETLLVELIAPATHGDRATIDEIIARGEGR